MAIGRVVAIAMVKDELDIVESTVSHMVTQVDSVVVADNGSTDGTREVLERMDGVEVIDDPDPAYYQSRKMSALAARAAEGGADWVVPFDADELWHAHGSRIADVLAKREEAVAPAPIVNHVATAEDDLELGPVERIGWRHRKALNLHKVACRPRLEVTITQGNHNAHYRTQAPAHGLLEVRHFPYRSEEQFLRKVRNGAAAYAATDLPRDSGRHWREYGELLEAEGPEAVKAWFRKHFLTEDPGNDRRLIFDPCLR